MSDGIMKVMKQLWQIMENIYSFLSKMDLYNIHVSQKKETLLQSTTSQNLLTIAYDIIMSCAVEFIRFCMIGLSYSWTHDH